MRETSAQEHVPVLVNAAMDHLNCRPGGFYVDGTLGGGGYARRIVKSIRPGGVLLGVDWDSDAVSRVRASLDEPSVRVILKKASFARLHQILPELELGQADGVVLDLGVSSFQLEDPRRGFSFSREGPLDMRMDTEIPRSAADLVNTLKEAELARLIFHLGEDRWARRIARAIVSQRKTQPFTTTLQLAELIRGVVPGTEKKWRIHPATRTFQALRIAVNDELKALEDFLEHALELLKPGGRLCIVAFHSLEDRLVKERMRRWSKDCRCPVSLLQCQCEGRPLARLLTKKAVKPGEEETNRNPRARSARLRAVEKL